MPPSAEYAVGGELGLQNEQHERGEDQRQRRIARGQQIQREQRQQNEDHAHDAGHDRARMIELGVERERADREHEERDVRVEQEVEDALPQRHRHLVHVGRGQIQLDLLAVEALHRAPFELTEQVVLVFRDDVDEVLL